MSIHPVIIIGAGPAGLAAAMQLKRYGIAATVFEGDMVGGLLRNANLVENYPGFPAGITGVRLVRLFERQAREAGVRVIFDQVEALDFRDNLFRVTVGGSVVLAKVIVIASGTRPRRFVGIPFEPQAEDRILYEVYPVLDESGQRFVIVGAGDAAFDYALNLAKKNRVTVLNRGVKRKCLPLLWERLHVNPNIRYLENIVVESVACSDERQIEITCADPTGKLTLQADYLIGALGRKPQLDFLSAGFSSQSSLLEEQGRLYFIGDVCKGIYRQTSIAVGEGILAAMKIYEQKGD